MLTLFKTEIKKFVGNSTVTLLFVLFSTLFPIVILTGKSIMKQVPPPLPSNKVFYEFPTVWDYQGYVGNWLVFFLLGFMILHMFTSEVSYRTMRQNIITGYTKKEYFISKLIVIFALAIIATVLYTVSSTIIGMIHTPGFDMDLVMDTNWAPARFFLMSLGYMSFAFLIANIFRKGGLSMFMYFTYSLMLEPIIKGIHLYLVKNSSINYWPLNTIEDLMAFPLLRASQSFINSDYNFDMVHTHTIAFGMSLVYTVLFLILSWKIFSKSDI